MKKISMQSRTEKMLTLALFLSVTLIIGFIERNIPINLAVGVKLGLANVVILTMLYLFKPLEVFLVVILKCVILAIFSSSPTSFIYSLCGSVLSFCAMAPLVKLAKDKLSPIGISVVGAIAHNIGQIIAAAFVLGTSKIVFYLPVLLISGIITGVLVGVAVKTLLKTIILKLFS